MRTANSCRSASRIHAAIPDNVRNYLVSAAVRRPLAQEEMATLERHRVAIFVRCFRQN